MKNESGSRRTAAVKVRVRLSRAMRLAVRQAAQVTHSTPSQFLRRAVENGVRETAEPARAYFR